MTDKPQNQLPSESNENRHASDLLRQKLTGETDRLTRFSIRGIQALSLFIGISMLAWWQFPFFPAPETVTAYLGNPPSARIISIVLLLYTFSAIILSLSRMATGIEHRSSFCHAGYLTAFFLFYYFGKALEENFWAVFGAGITILGVESYRIWSYCAENIAKNKEDLEYLNRTGRPPPQE